MSFEQYTRVLDALTYAVHATAHRRDPKNTAVFIATRDAFAALYPEHRDAYVPTGDR
ncbi:Uncharacterised protein [Nocardiopsis dassonvillei]|uniref:Uncharacterized protein n=1 Tax=Nocardiopsis dassonvillei (strain ATCC 23218 / DSM 43111 / CIP 107115 / JCM 7437 / KCTC 9190 / NBRC 14626 / NCTC 10488 / NRRL B-5397 / IMRU 509) TaxID=446468 RepID=D7AWJ0_NOCDD|nr:hypothetical protein Ndas_0509 [Nocardiopsis dassonvillei subsp. dassonvillei DSM 43111]VEI91977.1 Uncharacterised protein [Nocardiopsis dassonvillei]